MYGTVYVRLAMVNTSYCVINNQSVNQADAILAEYAKNVEGGHPDRMPAQLAKAFLNGVFTATATHLIDEKQRDAQE